MDTEIDRMMLFRRLSIICIVLICIFAVAIIGILVYMNSGDYSGKNSSFALIETTQEPEEKSFNFEPTDSVYAFSDACREERTLFTNVIPTIKVVNSDKYSVDVKANKDLLDKLDIFVDDEHLYINFKSECYNNVSRNERDYKGLYVDCTVFEVTIYAPITFMHSTAEINLDFQAPDQADGVIIIIDGEVREGKIYNVNSDTFGLSLSGNSHVTVEGNVKTAKELVARHNTTIDASKLRGPTAYRTVTCQFFGFSKIIDVNKVELSILTMGFALSMVLILVPVLLCVALIIFRIKFVKLKKQIDLWIDKVSEEEENYLSNM